MQQHEAIKTQRYFDRSEIDAHLFGVEYIIMAAPAPDTFKQSPIHFTIFLNTAEPLPESVRDAVFEKFCRQYSITAAAEFFGGIGSIAFALTQQETPMPMHLVRDEDRRALPHTQMYVMDFLGDSDRFKEVKTKGLTGWSYSYS
jgi:hypothetical protein